MGGRKGPPVLHRSPLLLALALAACHREPPPAPPTPPPVAEKPAPPIEKPPRVLPPAVVTAPADVLIAATIRIYLKQGISHPQIHVMRADGSEHRVLTTSTTDKSAPALSSDGQRVAYVERGDGSDVLHVLAVATGRELQRKTVTRGSSVSYVGTRLAVEKRDERALTTAPVSSHAPVADAALDIGAGLVNGVHVLPTFTLRFGGRAVDIRPRGDFEAERLWSHEWSIDGRRVVASIGTLGASAWTSQSAVLDLETEAWLGLFEDTDDARWLFDSRHLVAMQGVKATKDLVTSTRTISVSANDLVVIDVESRERRTLVPDVSLTRGFDLALVRR